MANFANTLLNLRSGTQSLIYTYPLLEALGISMYQLIRYSRAN